MSATVLANMTNESERLRPQEFYKLVDKGNTAALYFQKHMFYVLFKIDSLLILLVQINFIPKVNLFISQSDNRENFPTITALFMDKILIKKYY